ncbi:MULTISPECIES: plasmid transfer protein [Capnocytophaga]|uniref:Conjugative transposon TraJ C-terminal domain-containing protein n=1 Tax=Capnocytophaga canis TaxID=1848903 RepID=A0A0B7IMA4_9FLAO|nr:MULTISPECIES: plasmid transfer protein [Capnocytophaga]GJQ04030.1 plasmid transfer protein [Capnocytophaga canimorsus]CEN53036.1 conserved membrane hypothetical protein [Capnocytophaga canis]
MNELIDKGLLTLIEGLRGKISELFGMFIYDAQALAAVFMLLYFGIESYKMMSGDKKLEIMALLRPFALGFVLIFWIEFVAVISYPPNYLTAKSKNMFEKQLDIVENLSRERYAKIDSVAKKLNDRAMEVWRAEKETEKSFWDKFKIDLEAIKDKIASLFLYVVAWIKQIFFSIIEFIVVTIWQVCVYIVLFLQLIFSAILIIFGPISFALSIIPAFKDAYIQWLSRYISVSLYGCIAYICLSVILKIMIYGQEQELQVLTKAMTDEEIFIGYTALSSGGINLFIITCLLGAITMLTIPTISTWIIATSGVGQAISGMTRGVTGSVSSVARVI